MRGKAIVKRARALLGCKFRPQGRDASTGLDCVGLVLAAYGLPASTVRRDYRLRGDHRTELEREIAVHFTRTNRTEEIGKLMLCNVAPDQLHLAIGCSASFIHADAGIGRIVETPGAPPWPVLSIHRLRSRPARKS